MFDFDLPPDVDADFQEVAMRSSDNILVHAEDRVSIRRAVRLDCQVVRARDFKLVAARVLDLSFGGLLVETDDKVLTGEPVIVSFRAPRSEAWVDGTATVARVVHGRRAAESKRALGLTFDPLDARTRAILLTSLRRLPPARARRATRVDYAATVRRIAGL